MNELGELFGSLIIILYVLTISKYILRNVDKKYSEQISKFKYYNIYLKIKKIIMKYHRVFGVSTILVLLIHFIMQFTSKGISITGALAATLLISQVVLGIYMVINKKKLKQLLKIHKIISIIILLAILIHII